MNLEDKTDRQLIEEVILQNITLYKQGREIDKKVNLMFVLSILSVIGAILFVIVYNSRN